jgi:hypothetical protein
MKQLTSIVIVFLSVVVISLACFRPPRVETSAAQLQIESTMAMRKWQAETSLLYRDRSSDQNTIAERQNPSSELNANASLASASMVRQADGKGTTNNAKEIQPTSGQSLLSTSQTQWETIANFALADADRWGRVRSDVTPQVRHRQRSTWAWTVALGAGSFAIAGLLVSSWIAPERTIESTRNNRGYHAASRFDDWPRIQISIPDHWVEVRQSVGVLLRRWFGYVLVVTALVACWVF